MMNRELYKALNRPKGHYAIRDGRLEEFDEYSQIPASAFMPMHHEAGGQELAQKILTMIESARKEAESLIETYAVDCLDALVDDIEALCKEHVSTAKEA